MKNKEEIGIYLRMLREENEMTQVELAKIFHVEPQTVSKWETGLSLPDVFIMEKLSEFYRISVTDLLSCNIVKKRFTLKQRKEILAKSEDILLNVYRNRHYDILLEIECLDKSHLKEFVDLENILWKYDDNKLEFINPEAELAYKDIFMRDILFFSEAWEKFVPFMIKNFSLPYESKTIEKLFEMNMLHKYFVSYIGPLNELYPEDVKKFPELANIPYKAHPNIELLRQYHINKTSRDVFEHSKIDLISKLNLIPKVSFHEVKNGLGSDIIKSLAFIEKVIENLYFDDAYKSLVEIISLVEKFDLVRYYQHNNDGVNKLSEDRYIKIKNLVKKSTIKYLEYYVLNNKNEAIFSLKTLFETYFSLEEFSKIVYEHADSGLCFYLLEELEIPILDKNQFKKFINESSEILPSILVMLVKDNIKLKNEIQQLRDIVRKI